MKLPIIAIDGPAGSGKSTAARGVASTLGLVYVDTGAIYRSVAQQALQQGIPLDDAEQLGQLARQLDIHFLPGGEEQRVYIGEQEITQEIRTSQVSTAASKVSALAPVRKALLALQRALGSDPAQRGAVLEGRDIGTVVFPDADLKIFLRASVEERAERRHRELQKKGKSPGLDQVVADIADRDRRDENRANAPLRRADDAVDIDSTQLEAAQVAAQIVALARQRLQL